MSRSSVTVPEWCPSRLPVQQDADPAMTQRKYMARGRAHPQAAAALDRAVAGVEARPTN
ncbi:hypothetical protein [Skermania sp. ID1734]|uniref:hypothetical protein n=1 Tax=Skermania sp. ID1734 TaxID=2597516 RepID=UPI00163DC4E2|nr:hypothetical protein [Skermania sp. ID1734]